MTPTPSVGQTEHSVSVALLDALWEAPIGLALLDQELRYLRVNPTLALLDGCTAEQHIGRPFEQLFPDASPSLVETLRRVLKSGDAATSILLSRQNGRSGSSHHWVGSYFPVRSSTGETTGLICALVEITERMRAQEHVAHGGRGARAEEQLVISVVGHDLRTPLAAILTTSNVLLQTEQLSERQSRLVTSIQRAATRMEMLTRDLLDYSRTRWSLGLSITPRAAHLDAICRSAIEEATASFPDRRIHYFSEGDGRGEWDVGRLSQLLGNVLDNALIHGDPERPVELRWRSEGDRLVIQVENRGHQIPADCIPRLFEPFCQLSNLADRRGCREGTGLGLFIAREIVQAHGGRIEMTSDAASTIVSTWLPRRSRQST